jgi:hypothetical protein
MFSLRQAYNFYRKEIGCDVLSSAFLGTLSFMFQKTN